MSMVPDPALHAPTAQTGGPSRSASLAPSESEWLTLAQNAYESSTSYVDTNYRKSWEDSIRAFNNQHASDSKYNAPSYEKRSHTYRPKTRSVIRKNEAATAAAFFSNMDVINTQANDPNNQQQLASAEVMKQLVQYRLTHAIPWYQIVLGGIQDAQTTGVACAHVHWEFEKKVSGSVTEAPAMLPMAAAEFPQQSQMPEGAMAVTDQAAAPAEEADISPEVDMKILKDRPAVDLFPIENLRIDPGANWIDPVNSSPYLIHLIPMYALDVKAKIEKGDWRTQSEADIKSATDITPDTTRIARNKDRTDPYASGDKSVSDYEIVWVQRHIHRRNEEDWEFYTLGDISMLTAPRPLSEVVFTGKRPYVIGCCILETHKVMPASVAQLGKGLQDETNEIANQRLDNVKFVLNKKYLVKRGKEADVQGLLRNVPGGVAMFDDPQLDVRELTWQDVTASSFQEHKELSMEMDELLGNFNPAMMIMAGSQNSPAKNMAMLANSQGTLTEYLIRTYVETFVQPVLRQLVLLEQAYETDEVILALAGKKAQLLQKFGISKVTDELLEQELTLTVNVGMGATDPTTKLNKFLSGVTAYTAIAAKPVPGLNLKEVGKEIFAHLGYNDGDRFTNDQDPKVQMLTQQLQQAMQEIQKLQAQVKEKQMGHQVKLVSSREANQTKVITTQIQEKAANQRALATHWHALMGQTLDHQHQARLATQKGNGGTK